MAVVGRIARPHGIRGQVIVNPETDFPDERFQPGAELFVERRRPTSSALIVATVAVSQGRPVVGFAGVDDMNAASALAGLELRVPADRLARVAGRTCSTGTTWSAARSRRADGARVGDGHGRRRHARRQPAGGGRPATAKLLIPLASEICRDRSTPAASGS